MAPPDEPPRPASLPAGWDEEDPYADEDLETYPGWWRSNVEAFRRHGMRPYRPPRFRDGTLTTPTIEDLEARFDVSILIRTLEPEVGGEWEVVVDGEVAGTVDRRRTGEGYTEYDLDEDSFVELVRQAAGPGTVGEAT